MKKWWVAGVIAIALISGGVTGNTTLIAQAKTISTLKTTPRQYRHQWYHYEQGQLATLKLTGKKISSMSYYGGRPVTYTATIHMKKAGLTQLTRHDTWSTLSLITAHQMPWLNVRGWNQVMGAGDFYRVMTETYHGKRVTTLSVAGGAGVWTSAQYYRSAKLAKQLGTHHFKDVVYYPAKG